MSRYCTHTHTHGSRHEDLILPEYTQISVTFICSQIAHHAFVAIPFDIKAEWDRGSTHIEITDVSPADKMLVLGLLQQFAEYLVRLEMT